MKRSSPVVVVAWFVGLWACNGGVVGEQDSGMELSPAQEYTGEVPPQATAESSPQATPQEPPQEPPQCANGYHLEGTSCVADEAPVPVPVPPVDPCAGLTCSGHGTCAASGGVASCQCASGYHAEGMSCVVNPPVPQPCVYPAAPYGSAVGSVIFPQVQSQCYAPAQTTASAVAVAGFFDCDGSKHVNAVLIEHVASFCGACQQTEAHLGTLAQTWASKGIVLINVLLDGSIDSGVKTWRDTYDLGASYVCDTGANSLFPGGGVPYGVLVDPRTMKIVGAGTVSDDAVTALATKNGAN